MASVVALAKSRIKIIKRDAIALWIAARDPRTPWYAKAVAGFVAAYALSPIDLIPDFIPVVGYLDDLLIVPLGIALSVRLIPPAMMSAFRAQADHRVAQPHARGGLAIVLALWIAGLLVLAWLLWPRSPVHPEPARKQIDMSHTGKPPA